MQPLVIEEFGKNVTSQDPGVIERERNPTFKCAAALQLLLAAALHASPGFYRSPAARTNVSPMPACSPWLHTVLDCPLCVLCVLRPQNRDGRADQEPGQR